jgi:tetratricopeptide (TPR) repeat protein
LTAIVFALRTKGKHNDNVALIAKAGITGIAVFALFSYPAQILPIKVSLICYLACIATLSGKKTWHIQIKKTLLTKCVATIIIICGGIVCIQNLILYHVAWKNRERACELYAKGFYEESLNYYDNAWFMLKTDGEYLSHYGKALSMAGKHEQAIEVLLQAVRYYPNTVIYTALGDSYKNLRNAGKAEQSYLKAWHMIPCRFYPKYLLAKLYDETGQTEKAIAVARELLEKEVKIESTAIKEIKAEMGKILRKYQGSNVGFKLQKWRSPLGEKNT